MTTTWQTAVCRRQPPPVINGCARRHPRLYNHFVKFFKFTQTGPSVSPRIDRRNLVYLRRVLELFHVHCHQHVPIIIYPRTFRFDFGLNKKMARCQIISLSVYLSKALVFSVTGWAMSRPFANSAVQGCISLLLNLFPYSSTPRAFSIPRSPDRLRHVNRTENSAPVVFCGVPACAAERFRCIHPHDEATQICQHMSCARGWRDLICN